MVCCIFQQPYRCTRCVRKIVPYRVIWQCFVQYKNTDVVEKKLSLKPVVRFIDIAAINVDSYPKSYEINIINNDTMHQAIPKRVFIE